MSRAALKEIERELEATGLPFAIEHGSRLEHIRLVGVLVLSVNTNKSKRNIDTKRAVATIRRASRQLGGK